MPLLCGLSCRSVGQHWGGGTLNCRPDGSWRTLQAWFFLAFPFLCCFALPWWWSSGPDVLERVDDKGGMPEWAFDFLLVSALASFGFFSSCLRVRPHTCRHIENSKDDAMRVEGVRANPS